MRSRPHSSTSAGAKRFAAAVRNSANHWRLLSMGLIAAALSLLAPHPASAHGDLGAAKARCLLFIGPDIMKFTGYTPDDSKNEFCEDIPSTGKMIMVLDAEQAELRDMKIDIRIVRDVGGPAKENDNLEAITVAHKPPRYYRTGTVNFEHSFPEAGYFVGIVTVDGDHGEHWVSRFPFSVGLSFERTLPVYIVLVLAVIASYFIYMNHRPAPRPVKAVTPPRDPEPHGPPPTPAE
ncbi:MAG TPA: hypothetical protein VEH76_08695 [Methylocystis sp.]|nr:hypothetical protein [Methylocystis sp.]